MTTSQQKRLIDPNTLLTVLTTILLAGVSGLVIWISKIDDRQYAQKSTYATKKELQVAIDNVTKVIDNRFAERAKAEAEARTAQNAWLERIETQLIDIRNYQVSSK